MGATTTTMVVADSALFIVTSVVVVVIMVVTIHAMYTLLTDCHGYMTKSLFVALSGC